jgi:hypothetical protein
MSAHIPCPACEGRGTQMVDGSARTCRECNGSCTQRRTAQPSAPPTPTEVAQQESVMKCRHCGCMYVGLHDCQQPPVPKVAAVLPSPMSLVEIARLLRPHAAEAFIAGDDSWAQRLRAIAAELVDMVEEASDG